MSDDVQADALRDLESDRAFLDGTSPFDAPGAGYRLNTWVRTRIPALLAELDRVTSQRDQAIELGCDIDLLASASLRTLANQRDVALATLQQVRDAMAPVFSDEPMSEEQVKGVVGKAILDIAHILDGGGS